MEKLVKYAAAFILGMGTTYAIGNKDAVKKNVKKASSKVKSFVKR